MLLFTIALSAGVYCLALLGSLPDALTSPIWPAAGFQIAMLFRFGTRALWAMTPGLVLIQLQLGLSGGLTVPASLLFAAGSWCGMCSEALITRWLTRPAEDPQLDARSFVRFAAYAAPLGAASSALLGVTILTFFGGYPDTVSWYIPYIVWWGGNLVGAYALVPLLTLTREQLLDLAKDWPATGAALALLALLLTGINLAPSIYLAQLCLVLLIVALYLLIRRQQYASFIAAISLGTLYFILLRINTHTVIFAGEQVSALLVLNLEIGLLLCGSIYVFRQVETNHRLTRQVQRDVLLLQSRVDERTRDLQVEVDERRRAEELAKRTSQLLTAVGSLRQDLIDEVDPFLGYRRLLERLLELTNSEYGFIGDLQSHPDTGKPFIKMYAISDLSWDKTTLALYESLERDAFEFHNMDNLMGAVVREQKSVVSNEPARDERAGGLPAGHPQLNSFVGIPVFYAREIVGEIGLANRPGGYDEEFLEWLEPVVVAIGQLIKARWDREARERAEAELRQIAATDPLTGLSNRRHFEGELTRAIRSHERHKGDLSILMLDLDHFKRVNDEHGHEVGDAVLKDIANVLRSALRDIDHIGRWGGEEFLMLVSHSDSHAAVELAERLRLRIEQHLFPGAGHLTASIGVAQWLAGDSDESIIARADAAMYAAKAAGRNCVRVADENGG